MLRTILHTAFHPPLYHARMYDRERCLQQLETGMDKRIIFLCAGTGFGKTSLMGLFYQKMAHQKLWFSIPEGSFTCDKLLIHLFWGLLEQEGEQVQQKWEPTLQAMCLGMADRETMVMSFLRLLEEKQSEFYFFLDDFQYLQWRDRHADLQGIQTLSRFAPKNIHFVIASRELLPIPVQRLRQEGQLLELKEGDLVFRREELRHFLCKNTIEADDEWVKWLWQKTEGWIAGICLILYCLRERNDIGQIAATLPTVNEYLTELLAAVPECTRVFLLKTSIFEAIHPAVCNEYLAIDDSQRILDELVEFRLLIHRYEEEGSYYYRYHNLLKEFFLSQLDRATIQEYHYQLAATYRNRNEKEMEVANWIAAGEDEKALELIKGDLSLVQNTAGLTLLNEWLDNLEESTVTSDPFISLYRGWLLALQGRLRESLSCYLFAEKGLAEQGDWRNWAWVRIQIADLYWWIEQYGDVYQICQETLEHASLQDQELRAGLYQYLGMGALTLRRKQEGILYLTQAKELAAQYGYIERESWVSTYMAFGWALTDGRVEEAVRLCEFALQNFKKKKMQLGEALATVNLGYIYFTIHELSRAENLLEEAERLCHELNNIHLIRPVYGLQSLVAVAQGDLKRGEEYLRKLEERLMPPFFAPHFQHGLFLHARACYHLKRGELMEAERDMREAGNEFGSTGDSGSFITEYRIAWILLYIAQGNAPAALRIAEEIEQEAVREKMIMIKHEVQFLKAIVNSRMGKTDELLIADLHPYPFIFHKYAGWIPKQFHPVPNVNSTEEKRLYVRFFGEFRLEFAERVITSHDWKNRKISDLFKYMLLHHDKWIQMEVLQEQFWPDREPVKAKQSLYVALYEIRRMWEPGLRKGKESRFVLCKHGMCCLQLPGSYCFDVEDFSRYTAEGLQLYEEQSLAKAGACLERALRLHRGDFLEEDIYDEWTQELREVYNEMYLGVLFTLAKIYGAQEKYAQGLPLLRKALLKNPFQDQLHELLILYWTELGQTNEAIQHFREYNRMYQEELGVEMPMKIRILYEKIVG